MNGNLTVRERHQLIEYLLSQSRAEKLDGMTFEDVARRATETGIECNGGHVKYYANEMGIAWQRNNRRKPSEIYGNRLDQLEADFARLKRELGVSW